MMIILYTKQIKVVKYQVFITKYNVGNKVLKCNRLPNDTYGFSIVKWGKGLSYINSLKSQHMYIIHRIVTCKSCK